MKRRSMRSGTWLVVAMMAFGVALASGLAIYLRLHTAPFQALTAALDEEYPGTAPRVDGGKRRLDQPGDRVLRIVMKTSFDPRDTARSESFAREVVSFTAEQTSVEKFDIVEVHLFHEQPEQELSQHTVRLAVEELRSTENNEP